MASQSEDRLLILVSNDDGVDAPGIAALAEAMVRLGGLEELQEKLEVDVYVVAPHLEQSAVGCAITVRAPVRADLEYGFPVASPMYDVKEVYSIQGTPADSVKLGVQKLLPRKPDLVVSGINRGENMGLNVLYSGTVSAAMAAAILGIDAVAVSLCEWEAEDFADAQKIACQVVGKVVRKKLEKKKKLEQAWAQDFPKDLPKHRARRLPKILPPGMLLNVNIPYVPLSSIRGFRVTRQAHSSWQESFVKRLDPNKRPYYWMTGTSKHRDTAEGTDVAAVRDGYVSITPIHYDLTARDFVNPLSEWGW